MVWYIDAHHDLDICSSVLPSPDWLSVTVFDSGIVANLWLQLLFLIAKLHPVHRHNSPAATHDFLQFTGLSPRLQLLLLLRIPVPYLNSRSLTKLSIVSFSLLITFNPIDLTNASFDPVDRYLSHVLESTNASSDLIDLA